LTEDMEDVGERNVARVDGFLGLHRRVRGMADRRAADRPA
jgi:hypothetical protein